jgi:uncharacterized repeat protein (TIGR03809 family)
MTQQHAPVRGREIIDRWCALAEGRLDYLSELFESGRWRRYHSEADFLDNIREAKASVETWRGLASQEASRNGCSWLDRPNGAPVDRGSILYEHPRQAAPQPAGICNLPEAMLAPAPPLQPDEIFVEQYLTRQEQVAPAVGNVAKSATAADDWHRALDPMILNERYPILRNAM